MGLTVLVIFGVASKDIFEVNPGACYATLVSLCFIEGSDCEGVDNSHPLYDLEVVNHNAFGDRFGIESKNVAARAKARKQTSQQYLEERTGWRFFESDRRYYPPENIPV